MKNIQLIKKMYDVVRVKFTIFDRNFKNFYCVKELPFFKYI